MPLSSDLCESKDRARVVLVGMKLAKTFIDNEIEGVSKRWPEQGDGSRMLRFSSVKMLRFAIQTRNAGICWAFATFAKFNGVVGILSGCHAQEPRTDSR